MQEHVEFIHPYHFSSHYLRQQPLPALAPYIDYFWETRFDDLLPHGTNGFTDILFPNLGYTYLINLGTPFKIDFANAQTTIKQGAFLPRNKSLAATHTEGNRVFGIKFLVSPILFEKKVNFYEYKEAIYSLSYLIDADLIAAVKTAKDFAQRVALVTDYYTPVIDKHAGSLQQVDMVTDILKSYNPAGERSIEHYAGEYKLTTRTLLRYFNAAVGGAPKVAFTILRIRNAIRQQLHSPQGFDPAQAGFYDLSHYHRHLKTFLQCGSKSYFAAYMQSVKTNGMV